MLMPAAFADPAAVRVLRLALRGRPEEAGQIRVALAPVDPPLLPPAQVVLLRRLAAGRADAGLAGRVRTEMARQVAAAVPAERADPARDEAVLFPSPEALFARLLGDLLAGRAAGCWWWEGFGRLAARPLPEAVVEVLGLAGLRLGALTAELARQQRLAPVWAALPPGAAAPLAQGLATAAGLAWPLPRNGAALRTSVAPVFVARWRPALAALHPADPRRGLAALAVALEAVPLRLSALDAALLLEAFSAELGGPGPPAGRNSAPLRQPRPAPEATEMPPPSAPAEPDARLQAAQDLRVAATAAPAPAAAAQAVPRAVVAPPQDLPTTAPPTRIAGAASAAPAPSPRPTPVGPSTVPAELGAAPRAMAPDTTAPPATVPPTTAPPVAVPLAAADVALEIHTRRAGTLFLVNVLTALGAEQRLRAAAEEGAGWRLLRDLARLLDLPETDPLDHFLRARIEEQQGGEPASAVPHPLAAPCAEAAAGRYGALWTPALIALPGRIFAGPTHLDLMLPAEALRIDIRLAGLDINPGWVPWLGRVLAFHYENLPGFAVEMPR